MLSVPGESRRGETASFGGHGEVGSGGCKQNADRIAFGKILTGCGRRERKTNFIQQSWESDFPFRSPACAPACSLLPSAARCALSTPPLLVANFRSRR